MTPNWADLIRNPNDLHALYTELPPLRSVAVRSIHLNHFGPAVTLRIDLPEFPQNPPQEWVAAEFDRFQCQLQFIAVESLGMAGWAPRAKADLEIDACGSHKIRVKAHSAAFNLSFDAADTIVIGHMSAFKAGNEGADNGLHQFVRKLDSLRFNHMPAVYEKTFYEHI